MPKEIAKAFEAKEYEERLYKEWEDGGYFRPEICTNPDAPSYTIVLPPPNVTGTLHAGHAGMLAYEDILIRYRRMRGHQTLWLPGTDHAAIATQTKVEKIIKTEGTSRHELGREQFLARVASFAQESHDTIVNQCRKMGASLDWTREAYTLDETRNKAVNAVFKLMYDDGLIVRGERIVNWCPRCHSTLADDEVEYREQKAKLYFFKYAKDFPITIATTRPETKLGDTAVAVNPKDPKYASLVGQTITADFLDTKLKIKIIADRNIDMEFGTGALGVTPAHSAVDWQMAEENGLEIKKVIDEDGRIRDGYADFSGIGALEARTAIIERLRADGLMIRETEIDNSLSVCYRCDTPIEPLPSLQWFVDVNRKCERLGNKSLKEVSIEAVRTGVFGRDKINIIPDRFEKTYYNWMENLRDWCISRQIWFGHQVPVWYRDSETYVGIEAPAGEGWTRDEATLDTWFSSGLWTFSTLATAPDQIRIVDGKLLIDSEDFRCFHPTQVLETGYDILFFWVARMIIMTTYAIQDIPFQDVYLHGLVLDDKGKKMSKSKGNVIDPLDMISRYGTDATRLSLVLGSAPGNDMCLSEEKISGFRNLINKLWNVSRFIITSYENLQDIDGTLNHADAWILQKMHQLITDITDDLERYRFSPAGERLRAFSWNELADWYIEASKFSDNPQSGAILNMILSDLLKLWHPFIPFVTEAIWENLEQEKKLIISEWPKAADYERFSTTQADIEAFEIVRRAIETIRNARSEHGVEPSRKISALIFAGKHVGLMEKNRNLLIKMRTGLDDLTISEAGEKPAEAIMAVSDGMEIYLIGAVDKAKEDARIAKEKENLEKMIKMTETKLANAEFVANAPAMIVEKEREKLANYQDELAKLA